MTPVAICFVMPQCNICAILRFLQIK